MTDVNSRDVRLTSQLLGAPLTNAAVFFLIVVIGCSYIIAAKLHDLQAGLVTFGPVAVMLAYALLIGLARPLRLRDDQSGDNLYYMGFLFTLTSLGVSLYQFEADGAGVLIVQNFGIAIASTITGIALRVFFNQMRRDPMEVEATARAELAQAARRVRRELDNTVLEFNQFRRMTQQMISDGLAETSEKGNAVGAHLLSELELVTKRSGEILETASKQSGSTLHALAESVSATVDTAARTVAAGTHRVSEGAGTAAVALAQVTSKLGEMRTPEQIIEIKLNPTIQGLSRAVNSFSKKTEEHAAATREAVEAARKVAENSTAALDSLQRQLGSRDEAMQQRLEETRAAAQESSATTATLIARLDASNAQGDALHKADAIVVPFEEVLARSTGKAAQGYGG
jgi:hypothetical protein